MIYFQTLSLGENSRYLQQLLGIHQQFVQAESDVFWLPWLFAVCGFDVMATERGVT